MISAAGFNRFHNPLLGLALLCLIAVAPAPGQNPNTNPLENQATKPVEGSQPASASGVNTGGAHPPVLDAQHRPITAGGFVAQGPVMFKDVAPAAGLANWTHRMGTPAKNFILETVGSGVALLDYDNDGWLDIYLVNGSTVEAMSGKAPPRTLRCFTTTTMAHSPT